MENECPTTPNSIFILHLVSDAQCMAYILARCPLRVRRVRICILPTGSTLAAACASVVSAAAFLASCKTNNLC